MLRRRAEGGVIAWLLMTAISETAGWTTQQVEKRATEIDIVRKGLQIQEDHFHAAGFHAAELDSIPMKVLVRQISEVVSDFQPDEILLPYPGDAHSDHRVTFEAASASTKWFRHRTVKRVLAYETPSETDFGIHPGDTQFKPNLFVNISDYLEQKLELMRVYSSELGEFPFPRSEIALRALAQVRGAQAGFEAAEAFMYLRVLE